MEEKKNKAIIELGKVSPLRKLKNDVNEKKCRK